MILCDCALAVAGIATFAVVAFVFVVFWRS